MATFTSNATVTTAGLPTTCCPAPPTNQFNYITSILFSVECDVAAPNGEASGFVSWVSRASSFAGPRILETLLSPIAGVTINQTVTYNPALCIGPESLVLFLNASPSAANNYVTAKVSGYTL